MAFDAFLKLEGQKITGESTDKVHKGEIEIYSFSWGASNPVTMGSAQAGMGSGKVSVSAFNVMKKTDAASPTLFQMCCTGQHFPNATVVLRKSGGSALEYLVYKFWEVFVESIQWSGSSGGDDTPTESLSLAFGKVTIEYKQQDEKGAAKGTVAGGWDIKSNAKA